FAYVRGEIDYRITTRDGEPAVEWSWEGNDDQNSMSGRGWAMLKGDELHGMIFIPQVIVPGFGRIGLNQRRRIDRGRRGEAQARQGRGVRQEPPETTLPKRRHLGSRLRGVAQADRADRDALPWDGRHERGGSLLADLTVHGRPTIRDRGTGRRPTILLPWRQRSGLDPPI